MIKRWFVGVYGSCLLLPPGRNILRINVPWSLGFSLTLLSTTPFIFGDEDVVLAPLKEVSSNTEDTKFINQMIVIGKWTF